MNIPLVFKAIEYFFDAAPYPEFSLISFNVVMVRVSFSLFSSYLEAKSIVYYIILYTRIITKYPVKAGMVE